MGENSENLPFSWGKMKARGGAKMDTHFYESFTFDNVKYSLYDCVYLFKHDEPEPYIGKIVKIWEQNQAKKVKILWFFLPNEIQNYLKDSTMEKEIFLASGEGIGLADINPLEAIAGKCSVVCISKDKRNRQPSPKEKAVADYIFYRFFDVGNCTLSDQLPEKIAGIQVDLLLNPKDEQIPSVSKLEVHGIYHKEVECPIAAIQCSLPQSGMVPQPERDSGDGERHLKDNDCHPDKVVNEQNEFADGDINYTEKNFQSTLSSERPSKKVKLSHDLTTSGDLQNQGDGKKSTIEFDQIQKDSQRDTQPESQKLKNVESNVRKLNESNRQVSPALPEKMLVVESDHYQKDLQRKVQVQPQKMKNIDRNTSDLDESLQKVVPDVPDKKVRPGPSELFTRPADRSKWFKLAWNDKLQHADEHGTLVYIQNLDTQFAAADIEELILEAMQLRCTAKPINHPTYDDPNNGKAYLIFKNKAAADTAVSRINSGLVVGRRPVYCSKGLLKVPKPSATFVGHLSTENFKKSQKQREEQKKAVSTSHCSQPNTMEYDLALEWIFAREKQEIKFRELHRQHADSRKKFESMGSKSAKMGK